MEVVNIEDDERPLNHRQSANWLSALTFWWTNSTFELGKKRELYNSDLPNPLPEHEASHLGEKLARLWSHEFKWATQHGIKPRLGRVLMKCFALEYLLYGLVLFIMELLIKPLQPLFIGLVVRYYSTCNKNNTNPIGSPMYLNRIFYYNDPNQGPIQKSEALVFATGVVLCSFLSCFIQHPFMMAVMHLGLKIRVSCTSLVYRKMLRTSLLVLSPTMVGRMLNLLSNDMNRFDLLPMFLHYLWIGPLQMVEIGIVLYFIVYESAFIGISSIIVFIPIQVFLACLTKHIRWKTAFRTDERVRMMNEIISGIQVIKMYGWELAFNKLIQQAREREMKNLVRTSYIRGAVMSFIMFVARVGTFLSILSFVLLDNIVTSEKAFVIVGYYLLMRQCMTLYFPQGVTQVAETLVAIRRIREFMVVEDAPVGDKSILQGLNNDTDDKTPFAKSDSSTTVKNSKNTCVIASGSKSKTSIVSRVEKPSKNTPANECGVRFIEACARWTPTSELVLNEIEFHIKDSGFTAIVGACGAGKSSLCHVILKELPLCKGYMSLKGTVSFCAEEPWLFAGTIRQNILFGGEYVKDRYKKVIRVCALTRDLQMLPYGDQTFIGERGMSLSGGQKARINLARSVYKQANIYLLDNCLSAVDTQVGSQIFERCFMNFLSDKLVILVIHQLQYLKEHHSLILMERGQVIAKGTYGELQKTDLNFTKLLRQPPENEEEPETNFASAKSVSTASHITIVPPNDMEVFEEERTAGRISCQVYKQYVNSAGNCCTITVTAFMFVLSQALASASDYFLTQWMNMEDHKINPELPVGVFESLGSDGCIYTYSVLTILLLFCSVGRSVVFFTVCMNASLKLHQAMFNSILFARMRFFFLNPSGRILNRFSKDIGSVDEDLPYSLIDFFQISLNLIGVSFVVCIVNYHMILPTLLICVGFYFLRSYFLKTSTSLKRLEAMARSPLYAHINASVQGLTTIRAHSKERILCEEFQRYQDVQSSAWFLYIAATRAFSLWLDCLCTLFIALSTYFFFIGDYDWFASEVGLGITQCITLTGLFPWGMRQSAEMENQMTSVERVIEYTKIEREEKAGRREKPRPSWPEYGQIAFENVELSYAVEEPPVLKKINMTVSAKEKIGIVGRTGAGKSTLIAALFRMGIIKGKILIDGVETGMLELHNLRKKIAIIPQDPVIFSGTMRFNLDPFREFTDEHLLAILSWVDMDTGQKDSLNRYLDEGGCCFSAGQKQLLCLARALVRNNRILIMDEATANMDPHTDHLIQQIIRSKFAHCTVLTIAHRLNTIMDSDRVLVLDAGKIMEFDHPYNLLQNKNGVFTSMLNQMGKVMADVHRQMAEQSYINKYGSLNATVMLPKRSLDENDDDDDDDNDDMDKYVENDDQ